MKTNATYVKHLLVLFSFFSLSFLNNGNSLFGQILFQTSFEGSNPFQGLQDNQSCCSYSTTASTAFASDGSQSFRSEVRANDPAVSSGYRAELTGFPSSTGDMWYGFSVYFETPQSNNNWTGNSLGHWLQWHPNNSGGSASLSMWGGGKWDVAVNPSGGSSATHTSGTLKTIRANVWHDVVMHVKWGSGGMVEVWVNDTLIDRRTNLNWAGGEYMKLGMNRWNSNGGSPTSTWVIYYDNVKIGRNVTYEDVDPNTASAPPPPANQPPTANAGNNITLTLPTNSTTLNGSGTDPNGTITNYAWSRVSGPTTFTFANANAASTGLSNLMQGTYVFRLTVTDNQGATATDDVTVTVNPATNQAPTANAGNNITLTLPTNTTTLTGSGADADGTIAGYAWSRVSGPTTFTLGSQNAASSALSNLVQGTYVFRLTVTDNDGATATDNVTVTVNAAANQAPTANAGNNITLTLPTNSTTLTGSGTDADGTIASYAWSRVSGPTTYTLANANAASTGLSNLVQGTYVFRLTVTDNAGATASDNINVVVNPAPAANQPPTANAGNNITITLPTNSTALNGSGADPDGTIASYAWAMISGANTYTLTNATAATANVTNLAAGTYIFRLTVTDNDGATASDYVAVTVLSAPPSSPTNQPPVANAGNNITLTLPANSTTLNGSGTDADGNIASYKWTKISGPNTLTITNLNAASTGLSNLVQGVYVFSLTVTDNDGATGIAFITVTVNAPANQPPTAGAGNNITLTLPTNSTTLNGSGNDPDGTIASYKWAKISGPNTFTLANANAATTGLSNLVQGVYVFSLTVTDNGGLTAIAYVTVTVNPAPPAANQPPIARAGTDITMTLPTNSTTLNGSSSTDPDGTIISYAWVRVSGPTTYTVATPNAATSSLTNLVAGTYVFRLTVIDNDGASATDNVTVFVNAGETPNQPPIADAGDDIVLTLPENTTILYGNASRDADGTITAYQWQQISGPTQAAVSNNRTTNIEVSSLEIGEYEFELKVTDNRNATATSRVKVIVKNINGEAVYTTIYPNPAPDKIKIQYMGNIRGQVKITIYDIHKRVLTETVVTKDQTTLITEIDVSRYSKGMYIMQAVLPGNLKVCKKFIKQ